MFPLLHDHCLRDRPRENAGTTTPEALDGQGDASRRLPVGGALCTHTRTPYCRSTTLPQRLLLLLLHHHLLPPQGCRVLLTPTSCNHCQRHGRCSLERALFGREGRPHHAAILQPGHRLTRRGTHWRRSYRPLARSLLHGQQDRLLQPRCRQNTRRPTVQETVDGR